MTMQAVADRLGVTPMALYRHVTNKADLLDGVVERILLDVPLPDPGDAVARAAGRAGPRHACRRLAPPPGLPPPAPAAPRRRLVRAGPATWSTPPCTRPGVRRDDAVQLERLLATAVLGFAASEAGGRFAAHSTRQLDADFQLLQDTLAVAVQRAVEKASTT